MVGNRSLNFKGSNMNISDNMNEGLRKKLKN